MSSENESPDNKNVTGKENTSVQGNNSKVIQLIKSIVSGINFSVFHISFPNNTSHSSPSQHKSLIRNQKKSNFFLMGMLTFVFVTGMFFVPRIIDKDASKYPEISLGEEILFDYNDQNNDQIKKLKEAFGNIFLKDNKQYMELLTNYFDDNHNSPELRVYWNNAKAALLSKNPIKIAVSIPIRTNEDVAKEILRGVALAQNEINDESNPNGINGRFLQVIIANDNNKADLAKQVAEKFVNDPSVLAVVGHNSSLATLAAKEIYKDKLVMITPTSFSSEIEGDPYIFRMVPRISYFANKLARYIEQKEPNSIVGTCYDPGAPDNSSFVDEFEVIFNKNVSELPCDFLDKTLDSSSLNEAIEKVLGKVKENKINALVVAPFIDRIDLMNKIFIAITNSNNYFKIKPKLYGNQTFFTKKTLNADKAVEGLTLPVPWYPNKNDPKDYIIDFQNKFQQLYHVQTNNWRTAMAYDATWIIATGLERILTEKQDINREQLNLALRSEKYSNEKYYPKFTYDGATGTTTFSYKGVNKNKTHVMVKIQNGQFVPVSNQ